MKKLVLSFLLLCVTLFVGCGGSGSGSNNPPAVTLVSIQVTPANPSVATGNTKQFVAIGVFSDGSTTVLTSTANWLSSNTSVATINTSGLATGVAPGTSTISASSSGITGTTTLTVLAVPLVSIVVTPANPTVAPNGTQQFTATGTYADQSTKDITSSVMWSASVGASITAGGLATGMTPGATSTIMATLGTISGTTTLTVTNPLVSIAVAPAAATVHIGFTQQFTATGTYADQSTSVITSQVTWASSDTTIATISNSLGTVGVATGVSAGTASITAASGSITSPAAALTVSSATLVSIAVTPANPAIVYQTQQQFTATGTFNDSTTQDITNSVTWASADTTKITMTVSGIGTGVGTTTNPVTISATKGSVSGSTLATVVAPQVVSIAISPNTTTLAQGTSLQYTATATLSNGSTLNVTTQASWTSSDTTIATVGLHTGLVKAAASVSTTTPVTITASYSGVMQTIQLNVTNATPTSVTVTPIAITLPAGVSRKLTATATFSDSTQQDISRDATWGSDNNAVATVSGVGLASAVTPGVANITATFGGQSGTAQVTVSTATLSSIVVTPTQAILAPASTLGFQAVGHYSDGSTQIISPTWNSSDPTVVTIAVSGVATGQQAGSATITASYQGVTSNSANVIVTQFPLVAITVAPATATIPQAVLALFAATGRFQDGSTQNLTTSVTWASSPSSVATISNAPGRQGFATGISVGQAAITAVFASVISPAATLNVTNATIVSIVVTPSNPVVTHGSLLQFNANGTFSDSSVISLTSQVTWTSSDATVATISSAGLVSTVAPGTAVITATFTQNGVQVSGTTNLTVQ